MDPLYFLNKYIVHPLAFLLLEALGTFEDGNFLRDIRYVDARILGFHFPPPTLGRWLTPTDRAGTHDNVSCSDTSESEMSGK